MSDATDSQSEGEEVAGGHHYREGCFVKKSDEGRRKERLNASSRGSRVIKSQRVQRGRKEQTRDHRHAWRGGTCI